MDRIIKCVDSKNQLTRLTSQSSIDVTDAGNELTHPKKPQCQSKKEALQDDCMSFNMTTTSASTTDQNSILPSASAVDQVDNVRGKDILTKVCNSWPLSFNLVCNA